MNIRKGEKKENQQLYFILRLKLAFTRIENEFQYTLTNSRY